VTGGAAHGKRRHLDESYEAAVDENSTLAMLMEAISVDQTFYVYDTETVIRFISDSVQPIPTGS